MHHELPTGTVTFLFTDMEGSTRLLRELGAEAYAQALGATVSLRPVRSGSWTDSSWRSSVSGRRTHARIRQAPRGLIGRADVLLEEAASELQQFEGRLRAETDAELRARLGEDAYAAVYAEGRALALEDALALALRPD